MTLAGGEFDCLGRARAMVPVLSARQAEATVSRNVPTETIDDLRRAGLMRLLQPRRFGGAEASVNEFLRVVEILAEGCASSAWVYGVLAELEWVIACFPEQAQIDICGDDPHALAAGSIIPRATATPANGGWRITGRYGFASGCRHAQWVILGVLCPDEPRYAAVPVGDLEIIDDWHAMGMRGTGSFSVALHDVFVPAHRTMPIADVVAGTPPGVCVHPEYVLLRAPRYFLVPFVLPAVGFSLARRALSQVTEALKARTTAVSDASHLRLGEASALIDSAHLIFTTRRDASVALLEADAPIPQGEVLRNRRDVVLAYQMLRQGVERLVSLNGARSVSDADPLQPLLRDFATIATHTVVNEEMGMVPYGRFLLALS